MKNIFIAILLMLSVPSSAQITVSDTAPFDFQITGVTSDLILTGFTNSAGTITATGAGNYTGNIAQYGANGTVVEDFLQTFRVTVSSVSCVFAVGKENGAGQNFGNFVTISTDGNIRFYTYVTTGTPVLDKTVSITGGLTIANGGIYTVSMRKKSHKLTVIVTKSTGETFTITFEIGTDTGNSSYAYGKPTLFAHTGTISCDSFSFKTNKSTAKYCVWGDSFLDGGTLGIDYKERWIGQLMDYYGEDKFACFGRSGETSSGISLRIPFELTWCKNPKYVILAIGTNTTAITPYTANIQLYISYIIARGAIPILTTVVRTDAQTNVNAINAWIRGSGYRYIEFANALTTTGANDVWKPGYVSGDNVHPTIAGYDQMAATAIAYINALP